MLTLAERGLPEQVLRGESRKLGISNPFRFAQEETGPYNPVDRLALQLVVPRLIRNFTTTGFTDFFLLFFYQ